MKYMKNKNILVLFLILLLAFVVRIYNIANNPPSLTTDEAALGYNAYSLIQTGRDEHGAFMPVVFKSFGDYKPGLYVYLTVPFVYLFGLSEMAVRLPSVFMGSFSVLLLYLITLKLFSSKTGLYAALLLAINPWSVHFSRGAWEVNVALSLTLLAVYLFFMAFKNPRYLLSSAFVFGLTLWTYQGAKFMSLVLLVSLVGLNFGQFKKLAPKYLLSSLIIGVIFLMPIALSFLSGQTGRLSVFSIFSYPRPDDFRDAFLSQANVKVGELSYYLFYSEPLNFLRGIAGRYFNHYSTDFLFFIGDWQNPRHSPPYHGMMLLSSLVTIPVGLFYTLRKFDKGRAFILLWLLLAPLPAALSRDQVHAVRALYLSIPLVMLASLGIVSLLERFGKKAALVLAASYLVSFVIFVDSEFIHLPVIQAQKWGYGYKEIALNLKELSANREVVYVQQSYEQPYIYYLFYSKYDPQKYQKTLSFQASDYQDVGLVNKIDNVHFVDLDWGEIYSNDNAALVVNAETVPLGKIERSQELNFIKSIRYPNGVDAYYILEIR